MQGGGADDDIHRDIGPFRLLSVIGEGGMGLVYRAEHRETLQKVAVKTVRSATPSSLLALRSEIASLQAIRNPGVVRVFDSGVNEGMPWYAMELIEGRTLRDFNRELWGASAVADSSSTDTRGSHQTTGGLGRQPLVAAVGAMPERSQGLSGHAAGPRPRVASGRLGDVLALYRSLCAPLAHIHSRGLTHRDLKPANVFLREDGTPVIADFGLVSYGRGTIGRESLQANAPGLGTVSYVAPEQILGRFVDPRSDLYSVGCMLYETLSGVSPFGNAGRETLDRHLGERPRPLSDLVEGVPRDLEALVMSLLAKSPQDRLGYAADIAAVLAASAGVEKPTLEADYLYRPQIVGRQEILSRLAEVGARLDAGRGGLVLLGGASGLGKTFALAEFARRERQRGRKVITGECLPISTHASTITELSGGPLHPLRKVLRSIADDCRRGGQSVYERLLGHRGRFLVDYEPEFVRFSGDASTTTTSLPALAARERVLESLRETIVAYSREAPLLVLLDDLQWADELTIAFLTSLPSTMMESCSLLIVGSYRAEEVGPELERLLQTPHVERIALDRLDDGTVEAIVHDMLGMRKPPQQLVSFLGARAEGNPFFIAEYLRLLVAEGLLKRVDGRWQLQLDAGGDLDGIQAPRSLEGIINRRLESLSIEARQLVGAASVLGRDFSREALAAVLNVDAESLGSPLRDAKGRQVIEEIVDDQYRFAHDKLRESAYASGDRERLSELHRRAAVHLESAFAATPDMAAHYSELARHYREAGDRLKTIEYLDKAGGEALGKSAYKEAVLFLREAIRLVEQTSRHLDPLRIARWHRQISDGLQGLGRLDESAIHLRRAAALLQRPAPEKGWRLTTSLLGQVTRQTLHRLLPRLFLGRRAQSPDLAEAGRVHDKLLQILYFSGDPLEMMHSCVSALNLAELAGESLDLASAYSNAFAVTGIIPIRGLAEFYRRRAFEMNEKRPGAAIECYLRMQSAGYSIGVADWERARSELERGLAVARELGYRRGWEDCCFVDSVAAYLRSGFDESIEKASALYHSALRGDAQTQAWGLIQQAYVLLIQNRVEEAGARLDASGRLVQDDQRGRPEYPWFHAVRARFLLRRGELSSALSSARRALEAMTVGPPVYFVWMEAVPAVMETFLVPLERSKDRSERRRLEIDARKTLRLMRAQVKIFPTVLPQTLLWQGRLLGCLGKHHAAEKAWRSALAAAETLKEPFEAASAMRDLASIGRPSPASNSQVSVSEISAMFRLIGAEYDRGLVPETLGDAGGEARQDVSG
jgi:serine/threonine protein kinase/tetratricopeptide (TPR) repeat protein